MTDLTTQSDRSIDLSLAAGRIELSTGCPVARVGPLVTPTLAIAFEPSQLYLTSQDNTEHRLELTPLTTLTLPTGTRRLGFSGQTEVLVVTLDAPMIAECLRDTDRPYYVHRNQDLLSTARIVRRHLVADTEINTEYLESCLRLLSFQVFATLRHTKKRRGRAQLDQAEWHRVQRLIDQRLDQSISVTELADSLGLTPSQFSRAFKATVGYSPQDYIREQKVNRAREHLATSNLSLVDIALASGFCSQAHMTATFSDLLGVTPRRYREKTLVETEPVQAAAH